MSTTCKLCQRAVPKTTRHHLIPRSQHSNKWFKKRFSAEEMQQTVDLCRDCHREIHKRIDEKRLGRSYNSLEQLRAHPGLADFLVWLRKQNPF